MKLIPIDKPRNTNEDNAVQDEQLSTCGVVYKKNENGVYEFEEMLDPDKDYPEDTVAYTFRSVYVDVETIYKDTSVWNVKGSKDDPFGNEKSPNWLDVWSKKTKIELDSREGKCFVAGSKRKKDGTTECKGDSVGGHMALSKADSENPEEADYIYIIPICKGHNFYIVDWEMKVSEDVPAVRLERFMQKN